MFGFDGFGVLMAVLGSFGLPFWLASTGVSKFTISSEYMTPTKEDRQITTASMNLWLGKPFWGDHVEIHSGVTLTKAWGEITQLQGSYEAGTLHTATLESPANGFGPSYLIRFNAFPKNTINFGVDISGAVILYDRNFPAGGDIYNFMGRFGAFSSISFSKSTSLFLKYQWMHVSNGQGLVAHNPSYEAIGPSLGLTVNF